ncbi:MAG: helix-turn-helix domain-containing protein [Candidatus Thorarchaeota archaeon]
MDFATSENLFKSAASETRLRVMQLLADHEKGMRFSEITSGLEIHPSTLEDHLKKLVESELIAHQDSMYLPTLNTMRFIRFSKSLSSSSKNRYLSTHMMAIEDRQLREEFWQLDYVVLTDILSIVAKAKDSFTEDISFGFIGGTMNMKLEQSFFELWEPNIGNAVIDVVFTKSGVKDIIQLDVGDLFMKATNPLKTNIYVVEDCSWAIGGSDKGGLLYLPGLDAQVDFHQALCFETTEGIKWLRRVFETLRSKSQKMDFSEMKRILNYE